MKHLKIFEMFGRDEYYKDAKGESIPSPIDMTIDIQMSIEELFEESDNIEITFGKYPTPVDEDDMSEDDIMALEINHTNKDSSHEVIMINTLEDVWFSVDIFFYPKLTK